MDKTQIIIILLALVAFVGFGFMMNRSIKKLEANKAKAKSKKGRTKYMPQAKNPGR